MSFTFVLLIVTTLANGLLGGLNLGSVFARIGSARLTGLVWIESHQAEDAVFARVMPPFLIVTLLLSIASAVLSAQETRWLYAASAVLVLLDLGLTVVKLLPINREIAGWKSSSPPQHWRDTRRRWRRLHLVRTVFVLLAAATSVVALALAAAIAD